MISEPSTISKIDVLPLGRWDLLNSSTTVHEELPQLPIRQKGNSMKPTVGPFHTTSHTLPLPTVRYSSKVLWMESKIKRVAKSKRESFCWSTIPVSWLPCPENLKHIGTTFTREIVLSYTHLIGEMFCLPKLYKIVPIQESKKTFHISTTIKNLGQTHTGTRGSWFLLPTFISCIPLKFDEWNTRNKNPQDDRYSNL